MKTPIIENESDRITLLSKEQLLDELRQAVIELQLIEQGKLTARPIGDLLNEL